MKIICYGKSRKEYEIKIVVKKLDTMKFFVSLRFYLITPGTSILPTRQTSSGQMIRFFQFA